MKREKNWKNYFVFSQICENLIQETLFEGKANLLKEIGEEQNGRESACCCHSHCHFSRSLYSSLHLRTFEEEGRTVIN